MKEYPQFQDDMPIELNNFIHSIPWIKYGGTIYERGMVVCIKKKENLPVFEKIYYVIKVNDVIHFIINIIHASFLDKKIQAYYIDKSKEWQLTEKEELVTHETYHPQILP